jgi:hypothetical protein
MKTPDDIRRTLERRFIAKQREWFAEALDHARNPGSNWPLSLNLDVPQESLAVRHLDHVLAWTAAWRAWNLSGKVDWVERRWNQIGTQRLPSRLVLANAIEIADCVGETDRWRRAIERGRIMLAFWPGLAESLASRYQDLADYSDRDFSRLTSMLHWLTGNRNSGLYPRQIPLTGIDSKWIETHRSILSDFVCAGVPRPISSTECDELGLRLPPKSVRIRVLDPELRARVGNLCDLAAPVDQIAQMDLPVRTVYIVENIQTGLAFGDIAGSVLIMGLGYSVDLIRSIPWVKRGDCIYWGDLDSHGLSILARARTSLGNVRSVLMDVPTLLAFKDLWGEEPDQCNAEVLEGLTEEEQELFQGLRTNRWGNKVRLEQERIHWDYAWKQLVASLT